MPTSVPHRSPSLRQGFSNRSLQDIAERLGLTKAALYYHFSSRAELIASVLQPAIDDVNAFLDEVEDADIPHEELRETTVDVAAEIVAG